MADPYWIIEHPTRGTLTGLAPETMKPIFSWAILRTSGNAMQFPSLQQAEETLTSLPDKVREKCAIHRIENDAVVPEETEHGTRILSTIPKARQPKGTAMPRNQRKINAARNADAETLSIVRQYGWYIDRAFDFRKRAIAEQIANAKKTLEEPHDALRNDMYKSLAGLVSEAEFIQREFDRAHAALIAAGIK